MTKRADRARALDAMKVAVDLQILRRRAPRPAGARDVGPVEAVFARRTRGLVSASKVGDAHAMHDGAGLSLMLAPMPDGSTEIRVARQAPGTTVGLAALATMAATMTSVFAYLISHSLLVGALVGGLSAALVGAVAYALRRRKALGAQRLMEEVEALLAADASPVPMRVAIEEGTEAPDLLPATARTESDSER